MRAYNSDNSIMVSCAGCGIELIKTSPGHRFCKPCAKNRILANSSSSPQSPYFKIYMRDDFKCVYCGKSSIEDGVKLSVDHVFPTSKGGENDIFNLVTCCVECNSFWQKSNKMLSKELILSIWEKTQALNVKHKLNYRILKSIIDYKLSQSPRCISYNRGDNLVKIVESAGWIHDKEIKSSYVFNRAIGDYELILDRWKDSSVIKKDGEQIFKGRIITFESLLSLMNMLKIEIPLQYTIDL